MSPARPLPCLSLALGLLALGRWLGGCSLEGPALYPPLDGQPPRVVASLPADGWIQVPPGLRPRVWLSEPLDEDSLLPGAVRLWSGPREERLGLVAGEDEDGRGVLALEPREPLLGGVRYHLRLEGWVTDRLGNPLGDAWEVEFATAP
ncbi:MAG TPA: Ig-like domain-containing protein [Myxococcota bacterium]|nr:Ig-like domain-containing protein [Myxococcota bacterium]HRY91871.1 Ig-like domain-containing protein [Myxococcota bacterium]